MALERGGGAVSSGRGTPVVREGYKAIEFECRPATPQFTSSPFCEHHAMLGELKTVRVARERASNSRHLQGYLAHKNPPPPVGPYSSPMPRDL